METTKVDVNEMAVKTTQSSKTTSVVKSAIKAVQQGYDPKTMTKNGQHIAYSRLNVELNGVKMTLKWKPNKSLIVEHKKYTACFDASKMTEKKMTFIVKNYDELKEFDINIDGIDLTMDSKAFEAIIGKFNLLKQIEIGLNGEIETIAEDSNDFVI